MAGERRFALLKELRQDPPFWFHHAVMFCRFDRSQLHQLLEGTIVSPDGECYKQPFLSKSNASSKIQRAMECGLLEPIFLSIAEYGGDPEELVQVLVTISHVTISKFPWMLLAYLGTCNSNFPLVKRCINIIIESQGKTQEMDEIGMSYMVWRFLVKAANCTEECKALLGLPLADHDWTFVHLAAAYGDTECLVILLEQPRNQNLNVLRAATKLEGFTPLHLAAYYGHAPVVKLLLEHAKKFPPNPSVAPTQQVPEDVLIGIDIPRDRVFKRSPLHYASLLSFPEVVSLLIEKWGCVGVDLPDRFGITSLHCAVAWTFRGDPSKSVTVLKQLLEKSKNPNAKVLNDFIVQQAAMQCLLLDRRPYINSSTSTLFIPSPSITEAFFWSALGFSALHCIAVYGHEAHFNTILQHEGQAINLCWTAEDSHGLNPLDYADAFSKFDKFFEDHVPTLAAIAEAHHEQKVFANRKKAMSKLVESNEAVYQLYRLKWAYEVGTHLLSGSFAEAIRCVESMEDYAVCLYGSTDQESESESESRFKVDDEVWDHVEWALDKALQQTSEKSSSSVISGPRVRPPDAEEMVLRLVQKKVLHGKSPKQRCLQWAIGKRMARLAEQLVKDKECELVTVVPGSNHKESPLARASKSSKARDMPGLVAAMELREDVKRSWFEERQVYVDYANTVLVGAVLIAGLAFAGWLQPPRGYVDMGIIDMKRHTMRVFVWSSSLAFFLGMGTVVAGASGAMPFTIGAGKLVSAGAKLRRSVVMASMLLAASIVCLAISFSAALLAILPVNAAFDRSISFFLAGNGLFLCWMLFSFVMRLRGITVFPRTTKWARNLAHRLQIAN